MPFTVACAQFAPQKGRVAENLDRIAEIVTRARGENVDLVVFPETATTGYFLEGGALECALTEDGLTEELAQRLETDPRPIDMVVGYVQLLNGNLYNSAAYLEMSEGEVRARRSYQKFFLPTYGLFDEERFVTRGGDLAVFDTRLGKVAMLICEDAWHSILPTLCAVRGAQIVVVPAASPGRGFEGEQIGNLDRYERLMRAMAEEHGVFGINAQLCGFEGGKGFVGGSMVVDPFGRMVAQGPVNDEYLLIAPVDTDLIELARVQVPLIGDLQSAWPSIRGLFDAE